MNSRVSVRLLCISLCCAGACSHSPPAEVAPAPVAARPDSSAIARSRANELAARRDSIARADARRREVAARDDADRRARDAASAAAAARDALAAKVYFDFNRDALLPDAIASLDARLPILTSHTAVRIRVEGNTDDRGSDEYNLALGQRRAAAAKRYLVAHGVAEGRIETASYGEERPTCREEDEGCWHQNRRDEFVISAGADDLGGRH